VNNLGRLCKFDSHNSIDFIFCMKVSKTPSMAKRHCCKVLQETKWAKLR